MSENKKELTKEEIGRRLYQCLLALIRHADWIGEPYKKADYEFKDLELLNEVYLCACAGIAADRVIGAAASDGTAEECISKIRNIRQEYMTEKIKREYDEKTQRLENILRKLRKENNEIKKQAEAMRKELEDQVPRQKKKTEQSDRRESDGRTEDMTRVIVIREEATPKKFPWTKRENRENPVTAYIEQLIQDKVYTGEQIGYILDCIEEGVPLDTIKSFASPKLPVDVMKRLRAMGEKKEEK